MTDSEGKKPPDPEDSPPDNEAVEAALEQFIADCEDQPDPSVEAFVSQRPESIREELRQRCEGYLKMLRSLRTQREKADPADELVGKSIGEFEVVRKLGSGGMGVVYLAMQARLRRLVALKLQPAHLVTLPRHHARFEREGVTAARLQHPGIARILEVGTHEGTRFIAMEYIEGESLHERLQNLRRQKAESKTQDVSDPLDSRGWAADVARLGAQIADALHAAHEVDVIHRDVKPRNVLLDRNDNPHLIDFGLAKDLQEESLTQAQDLVGTIPYMSPEQALGKRIRIDHRTDVFSLGVVLYEMLTLQLPFHGDSRERLLLEISFSNPRRLRKLNAKVPRDLEIICNKALEKNPAHRYATAADLARDLRHFLNHESIDARPPTPLVSGWRYLQHHRITTVASGAVLATLLLLLGYQSWANRRSFWEHEAPLRELLGAATEGLLTLAEAEQALPLVQALEVQHGDEERAAPILREAGDAIVKTARVSRDEGLGLIAESYASPPGTPLQDYRMESDTLYFEGLAAVLEAERLLPENERIKSLDQLGFPTLSLDSDPPGAEVTLRPFQVRTEKFGPAQPLGACPLEGHSIAPGYYRIVVNVPGVGFAELSRWLDHRGRSYDLDVVTVRPDAETRAGMLTIEGGTFIEGVGGESRYPPRRENQLPTFLIDATETSHREYKQFIDATGHPAPLAWNGTYNPAWDDRPVTNVSFEDARAYAEWAGKRLPTRLEWERAARGRDGRIYPWGDQPREDVVQIGCVGRLPEDPTERPSWEDLRNESFQMFLVRSEPVRSIPESLGPEGLYHTLGNVEEWIDSLDIQLANGELSVNRSNRLLKGGSWQVEASIASLRSTRTSPSSEAYAKCHTGFRCAKSHVGRPQDSGENR